MLARRHTRSTEGDDFSAVPECTEMHCVFRT
jgi:hypothetical protein